MLKGVNLREMLPLAALSVVLILTLALSTHVASVSAPSEQSGNFHIEKNRSAYEDQAGSYCTTESSIKENIYENM
jgi:hypothetical protein